jgi:hypothetical protein
MAVTAVGIVRMMSTAEAVSREAILDPAAHRPGEITLRLPSGTPPGRNCAGQLWLMDGNTVNQVYRIAPGESVARLADL